MGRSHSFNRLEFQENRIFYNNVRPETLFKPDIFIDDGNLNLTLNLQSKVREFAGDGDFINTLKKSGAKLPMNIDRSLQNLGSYLILFHFSNNLCASAPLREKDSL